MFAGGVDGLLSQRGQLGGGVDDATGGGDVLAVAPGRLNGVEFGGVGRQGLQMDIADLLAPRSQLLGFVLPEVVEDHHQRKIGRAHV